jgi:hypothetical protein
MVCLYNCAEASGRNWDVTLAVPNRLSPLQAIEKRKFKSVPNPTFPGSFTDGQAFGRKGKLLGFRTARSGKPECTFAPKVASK